MKKIFMLTLAAAFFCTTALAQQTVRLPEKPKHGYTHHSDVDKGFWCSIEAEGGSSVYVEKRNMQVAGARFTAGYRFNEYLKVGAGFGGRYYFHNNDVRRKRDSGFTLPLYADIRGNFISQRNRDVVPYWSVNVGGAVWDGFFFSPTIGLRFGEERDSWLLGLSYSFNTIQAAPHNGKEANFLLLRVGYEF